VHPTIFDAYLQKTLVETLKRRTEAELRHSISKLPPEEAAVLALLQQRMERPGNSRASRKWSVSASAGTR
jgi:DNA topoisomerase-1